MKLLIGWFLLAVLVVLARAALKTARRSELAERARRAWCRRFGHAPVIEERGRPVTAFVVCRRCGKIGARRP